MPRETPLTPSLCCSCLKSSTSLFALLLSTTASCRQLQILDILLEPILALVYPEMIEESQRGGFYENIRCWTCLCLSMMSMESSSLMMGEMYTMDMAALLMRMLRLGPAVLCNIHLQVRICICVSLVRI